MRLLPQQILLIKPIPMLQTVAPSIRGRDLAEGRHRFAHEEKPTDPRVALGILCAIAGDTDHRNCYLTGFLEMQMMPAGNFDLVSALVFAFPEPRRSSLGGRLRTLESRAVFPGSPGLP